MRLSIFAFLLLGFFIAAPACRAQQSERLDVGQGAVTILTDGITNPNGPALRAMSELSLHLDKIGHIRVLPLMGYGGEANVRDLLKLRGADFALLNSDILAYLDQIKAYPEARDRIRYVTQLFDQKAFLVARADVSSIEQLAGKVVATPSEGSASYITAATIFGLLRIPAKIAPQPRGESLAAAIQKDADAVLLLEQDLAQLPTGPGLHLLPIPASKATTRVYRVARIEASEVKGLAVASPVETVKMATLLASFDWKKTHGRYPPVSRFIGEFFKSLPALRRDHPRSIWLETNVQAEVPGWERYSLAKELRATVPVARRQGAEVSFAAKTEPVQSAGEAIHLLVSPRPPLADQEQVDGGLIADLVASAMKLSSADQAAQPTFSMAWVRDPAEQLETLIKNKSADIGIAWDRPDCDNPEDLGSNSVVLCDNAVLSDPIFQSVVVLFTRADSNLDFKDDASLAGRTLCLPASADISDLDRDGRHWVSEKKVTLLRPNTLINCVSLVEEGKADAMLMHELEGRIVLQRLGIGQTFRIATRPVAVRGIHAIAAKNDPRGAELIRRLNEGLAKLKQSGAYAAIIQKQLAPLWRAIKAEAAQ